MQNFTFQCATKIIFGKGTESHAGEETSNNGKRVLLHYGVGHIKKSGLYGKIVDSLNRAGVNFIELSGVVPNPRLELVEEGIKMCRENKIDFILAVGGGSVIDSAKAIAAGFYYKGDVWELFSKQIPVEKALPVGVVLTIPAAGSEASMGCVITNSNECRKISINSQQLRPVFAIMNPELTISLPDYQTACGIADMMAHTFERYFTNTPSVDFTDKLCEATLRSIIKNARLVLKEPENYDYRAEIMWASTIAHNGLLGTGREEDWASHRIEHELSAFYDVAHGAGLAVIVPAWMDYVWKHNTKRFAQFAQEVFGISAKDDRETALKGIKALRDFFKEIGLPVTLHELKIDDANLEKMAKLCTSSGHLGSFVKLKEEDVLRIYELALK